MSDRTSLEPKTLAMHDAFMRGCALVGLEVRGTQYTRSMDEQLHIWAQGRQLVNGLWVVTEPSLVVTHAPPGSSPHNRAMAFDVCFRGPDPYLHAYEVAHPQQEDPRWEQVGVIGEGVGLGWGGRWSKKKRDRPHFERPDWKAAAGLA